MRAVAARRKIRQAHASASVPVLRDPVLHAGHQLGNRQSFDVPIRIASCLQCRVIVSHEISEAPPEPTRPGSAEASLGVEPVSYLYRGLDRVVAVDGDILVGHVRDCSLISVFLCLEDQAFFVHPPTFSEQPAPDIQTKLERHVQSIVLPGLFRLQPRQIVDGVFRFSNQCDDLLEPRLSGVQALQGDPRLQAEIKDEEQYRPQEWQIVVVEGQFRKTLVSKSMQKRYRSSPGGKGSRP